MKEDVKGLQLLGTFSDTVKPDDGKVVPSSCDYLCKSDQTGHAVKAKVRLIVKGFGQVEGKVDVFEAFAPTTWMSFMRIFVAFACECNLSLCHLDAEEAFVQVKGFWSHRSQVSPRILRTFWEGHGSWPHFMRLASVELSVENTFGVRAYETRVSAPSPGRSV